MDDQIREQLIAEAFRMLEYSYAPYSHFKVGAALYGANGKIYGGCNIENAAYGPSNCAERTAVFRAVAEGERNFSAICIVGGKEGIVTNFCPPCGVCRQVLREFCDPETFRIILAVPSGQTKELTLGELLPFGFGKETLSD